ncbi:ABC transporter permease [Streptomyces albofaciens JCM 4342]|uniref:FtsX-like permease family protein n=1 Tax=Streptomyces albofaciens TaxID=66866 RepID=UPI0012388C65|nr:ABC transporter permease [Streptomyces albofaciens]KAA6213502.1 ABC transporter permease [Streptomyces albofaciens JCM 4342]
MLLPLAWWTIRTRKVSFAGSFVTMLCALILTTACAVLLDAGAGASPAQGGADVVSFVVPFGFVCLFVMAFAVAGTFSLSVQQRTREIALLRAIAATPGQVRRLIAHEVLVITAVAAVPGCALGVLLADGLRAWLAARGMIPSAFPLAFGPAGVLSAVLVCWVIAEAAVWSSGRRASRVRALLALGEASVPRRRVGAIRTWIGLAVLAAGIWGLVAIGGSGGSDAANTAVSLVMVLMVAVALLSPWVGKLAGGVFGMLCRILFPSIGLLVKTNLSTGYRRLGGAAGPLSLTVAFAAVALLVPQMKWNEQWHQESRRLVADALLRSDGAGLPVSAAHTAGTVPGAGAAVGATGTYITLLTDKDALKGPSGMAQSVTDGPLEKVLDLGVRDGSIGRLGPRDIALSTDLAQRAHVRVGDTATVSMEDDRTEKLHVTAVYTRSRGFGEAVLPQRLTARHLDGERPLLDVVYVRAAPGAQRQLADGLAALHRNEPSWQVLDHAAHRAEALRDRDASMTATYLLLLVVTAFTSISVVNTLVMTTMERSGEFALLRLVGATRGQVARMMRLENAVVVVAALLVGAAVAGAVLAVFSQALTGSPAPDLPAGTVALILGGAGLLALTTGIVTTRIALRHRPAAALRGAG